MTGTGKYATSDEVDDALAKEGRAGVTSAA